MVDVVIKMKFNINKYSQVFNRVGPGYGGLADLIIIDQYVGFPGERYNFSFTDVEFHTISSALTLCRVNIKTVVDYSVERFDGSVDFDIVSKT
jgi:hypothetical protein